MPFDLEMGNGGPLLPPPYPLPPFSPSLISLMVSVNVKRNVYLLYLPAVEAWSVVSALIRTLLAQRVAGTTPR